MPAPPTVEEPSPSRRSGLAPVSGVVCVLLGAAVLAGWWGDISVFREPFLQAPQMVPNTALMFLLSGGALLLNEDLAESAIARRIALVGVLGVLGLATLTLLDHALDFDFGIERLLAPDSPRLSAPNTAVGFVLVSLALLVPAAPSPRRAALVEALSLGAAAIGMLTGLGWALEALFFEAPWQLPPSLRMAPHTGGGLLLLALGLLSSRRDAVLTQLAVSPGPGGQMARRLLLVALVTIPLATLGAFGLQQRGFWQALGSASVAGVVTALVLILATRFTGRRLDEAEAERARLAQELRSALAERQQMHESEALQRARLESIVAQMPVGVMVIDAKGELLLQNEASCALAKRKDPCVHDVRSPSGEPVALESQPLHRALHTGERITWEELWFETQDGSRVPVIASAAPILAGGQIVGAVSAFRDIRAQKELERLREEWASIIAHDMRQPVNAMALNLDLLRRVASTEKAQGPIERLRNAAQRLDRMIEDLLDVSRIESHRLKLTTQPLGLGLALEDALGGLPELRGNCQLRVEDGDLEVQVDRMRLAQILENLLTNATKYGDPGAPVQVRARREGDQVVVSVENRGPGISREELQTLFERFQRTRSAEASEVRGLGLGLYICRGLVQAHGGRIWAESEPGGITAFHFTLPLASETPAVAGRTAARASA